MLKSPSRFGALFPDPFSPCTRLCAHQYLPLSRPIRRNTSQRRVIKKESVEVKVGGSGYVTLGIWHPQSTQSDQRQSVVVYLPPGPSLSFASTSEPHTDFTRSLSLLSPTSTFASIDYRLSPPDLSRPTSHSIDTLYTYPQPIHDVSLAFSHLLDETIPSLFPPQSPPPSVILLGSRIGASLASMLALTHPGEIDGVFAIEPMVDWVILDELAALKTEDEETSRKKASKYAERELIAAAARRLIDIRTRLFRTPSAYLDAFASPTLFLRAPGRDTPRTHAEALGFVPEDENEEWISSDAYEKAHQPLDGEVDSNTSTPRLNSSNPDVLDERSTSSSQSSSTSYGPYDDDQPHTSIPPPSTTPLPLPTRQVKRRKVLRRWPPNYSSSMMPPLLPYFHVILAKPNPLPPDVGNSDKSEMLEVEHAMHALLHTQGLEFAELLKRACFFGRESGVAEERVQVSEVDQENLDWALAAPWVRQRLESKS